MIKLKKKLPLIAMLFIGMCILGCSKKENTLISQKHDFVDSTWSQEKETQFSIDVPEKSVGKNYRMYLELEHFPDVRKDVFSVEVMINSPQGDERVSEQKVFLKTPEGKFKGTASENVLTVRQILRSNFSFSIGGKWNFSLMQYSGLYYLPSIKSAQLIFVEDTDSKPKNN